MTVDYDALFVKNADGSLVFYPWAMGRGYVVHSQQQRDQIVRDLQPVNKYAPMFYLSFFGIGFLFGFLDLNVAALAIAWLIYLYVAILLCGRLYTRVLESFTETNESLGTYDSLRLQLLGFTLRAYIIFFLYFLIGGVFLKDTILIGVAGVLFVSALYKYYRKSLA